MDIIHGRSMPKEKKTITVSQKKASFMVIKLLGFKMIQSYQNIKFFGLHSSIFSTQQYIKIRTEKCRERPVYQV